MSLLQLHNHVISPTSGNPTKGAIRVASQQGLFSV